MAESRPRIKIPKSAKVGEVITIKTLLSHDMESGQRKDKDGKLIPRKIINAFSCTFEGETVFSCEIDPAISANPFIQFNAKVPKSGKFVFTWMEDGGAVFTAENEIAVS